jgi:hypothetical protein
MSVNKTTENINLFQKRCAKVKNIEALSIYHSSGNILVDFEEFIKLFIGKLGFILSKIPIKGMKKFTFPNDHKLIGKYDTIYYDPDINKISGGLFKEILVFGLRTFSLGEVIII